ncbi:glycoside hydrolase family 43 protein [bacterium]|nr:glycoside hydrolase family 43 protein [bacterium]
MLILFLSVQSPVSAGTGKYRNPVIPGFHPDPSVCRVGEDYYLVTSSFEYFPGVPVFHSKDLVHWRQIGHVLTRRSQLDVSHAESSGGIFAATIRHHDGIFYMVTTNMSGNGNFYVTAADPAGPWSDPFRVDKNVFDPSLFFDDDGRVYYTRRADWELGGTQQAEIDIKTGKLLAPLKKIADGFVSTDQEGPHLYKINGVYYLMAAEGGSRFTHMETIGRSKSPWGPFEPCPWNPILANHDGWNEVRTTGHADLFQDHRGNWWMVHLATRHPNYNAMSVLGRETFLLPVTWKDGWPVVNGNGRSRIEVEAPLLPPHAFEPEPARDDFDRSALRFCWNFLRNPMEGSWDLSEGSGFLRLRGNAMNLDSIASPAFVGRRQEHYNCTAEALMHFLPSRENEEAGLTCYMRDRYHYDVFKTMRGGKSCVVMRKTVADIRTETAVFPIPGEDIVLKLTADPYNYHLGFVEDGKFIELDHASCQSVATETASVWTGMYFAMYATGNGSPCKNPADFDWFEYRGE